MRRSQLPADALLNIVYSSSLAVAVVALSFVRQAKGSLQQLLFGDILGVSWLDLGLLALLLLITVAYGAHSRRAQILLTPDAVAYTHLTLTQTLRRSIHTGNANAYNTNTHYIT